MKNLSETLKEAKIAHKKVKVWETKEKEAMDLLLEKLKKKYAYLLLDRNGLLGYTWESHTLNKEIEVLLRSMLRVDKVFRIPRGEKNVSYPTNRPYYLTMKHGLKYPREWSSCNFLPSQGTRNVIPKLKKGMYNSEYAQIDFSVLIDDKGIDQKKLKRFFTFISAIIRLYKEFREIEEYLIDENRIGQENLNAVKSLGRLSEYSDIKEFEKILDLGPEMYKYYPIYVKMLNVFKENQENLIEKLKEYNRPFRVLLKLKKASMKFIKT